MTYIATRINPHHCIGRYTTDNWQSAVRWLQAMMAMDTGTTKPIERPSMHVIGQHWYCIAIAPEAPLALSE